MPSPGRCGKALQAHRFTAYRIPSTLTVSLQLTVRPVPTRPGPPRATTLTYNYQVGGGCYQHSYTRRAKRGEHDICLYCPWLGPYHVVYSGSLSTVLPTSAAGMV